MQPTAVVIVGLPTSGKTILGKLLAKQTGFHFIDIDDGPAQCTYPQVDNPYTSPEALERKRVLMKISYNVLFAAIEENLREGLSIIAAATFSRHERQEKLQEIATRNNARLRVLWCQYSDTHGEVERRIKERVRKRKRGGVRTMRHYEEDMNSYACIKLPHLVVKTDPGVDDDALLQEVVSYIEQNEYDV